MTENKRTRRPAIEVRKEALDNAMTELQEFIAKHQLGDENPAPTHPAYVGWITRSAKVDAAKAALNVAEEKAAKSKAVGSGAKRLSLGTLNEAGAAIVLAVYNEQLALNPAGADKAAEAENNDEVEVDEIKARVQAKRAARAKKPQEAPVATEEADEEDSVLDELAALLGSSDD